MIDDFKEFLKFMVPVGFLIVAVAVVAALISVFLAVIGAAIDRRACERYMAVSGQTVHYSVYTGCLVQMHDGRWVSLDSAMNNSSDTTIRGDKR